MPVAFTSHHRFLLFQLGLLVVVPPLAWPQNACDLNQDGAVNVVDVQLATNMNLGLLPCTANINGPGVCNQTVILRVMDAALGRPCIVDGGGMPRTVALSWTASTSPNVTGYNVYRGAISGGPYPTKVNAALIVGTSYTDTNVLAGQTYYYVATAMDGNNNESAYSNQAQAVIPPP
jgi:hypothetical protein